MEEILIDEFFKRIFQKDIPFSFDTLDCFQTVFDGLDSWENSSRFTFYKPGGTREIGSLFPSLGYISVNEEYEKFHLVLENKMKAIDPDSITLNAAMHLLVFGYLLQRSEKTNQIFFKKIHKKSPYFIDKLLNVYLHVVLKHANVKNFSLKNKFLNIDDWVSKHRGLVHYIHSSGALSLWWDLFVFFKADLKIEQSTTFLSNLPDWCKIILVESEDVFKHLTKNEFEVLFKNVGDVRFIISSMIDRSVYAPSEFQIKILSEKLYKYWSELRFEILNGLFLGYRRWKIPNDEENFFINKVSELFLIDIDTGSWEEGMGATPADLILITNFIEFLNFHKIEFKELSMAKILVTSFSSQVAKFSKDVPSLLNGTLSIHSYYFLDPLSESSQRYCSYLTYYLFQVDDGVFKEVKKNISTQIFISCQLLNGSFSANLIGRRSILFLLYTVLSFSNISSSEFLNSPKFRVRVKELLGLLQSVVLRPFCWGYEGKLLSYSKVLDIGTEKDFYLFCKQMEQIKKDPQQREVISDLLLFWDSVKTTFWPWDDDWEYRFNIGEKAR